MSDTRPRVRIEERSHPDLRKLARALLGIAKVRLEHQPQPSDPKAGSS
jgi:hypothetical protein